MCCELESTQIGCVCVGGGVDTFETKNDRLLSHPVFTCCRKSFKKSTMADHESVSCYLSGNNMGNVLHLVELIGQEVTAFLHQGEYWGVSCWSTYSSVIDHSAYNFLISNPLGDLTGSSHFSWAPTSFLLFPHRAKWEESSSPLSRLSVS